MELNRYDDFINESILIELLNEGSLSASSEFLDKLKSISNNEIADKLLTIFNMSLYTGDKTPQNFIDITPTEDMVSFISDDKGSESDNPYGMRGRGTIKIGRLVTSILSNKWVSDSLNEYKPTSKEIESFVNLYKSSTINISNKFLIVDGDEISYWYNEKRYESENGQLGQSCMRYKKCERYLDIYTSNPKVCKLLIYVNSEHKLLGRAMIWKLSESPSEAEYFMDRIYSKNDSDINKFQNYAKENGWLSKRINGHDEEEGLLFYYKGNTIIGKITVELKESKFKRYPYVDTLTFFNEDEKTLSNVGSRGCIILDGINGEDSGYCSDCNGKGRIKDWDNEGNHDTKIKCPLCSGILDSVKKKMKNGLFKEYNISNIKMDI